MHILNSSQSREYKRAQALAGFLTEEKETSLLYQPFAVEAGSFFLNNKKLLSLVPNRLSNGSLITEGKAGLKKQIAINANIICTRTAAFAIKTGDHDLEAAVYHRTNEIIKLKDSDVVGFVTHLVDTVTPLLSNPAFQPYAVTAGMLANVMQQASDFKDSIGKASFADSKADYISKQIDKVLKAIRGNIVQFNLLLNFFEKDYAGFVEGYTTAITVDKSGIHHTGISGVIRNSSSGQLVNNASLTLKGNKKAKATTTNEKGVYSFEKFLPGKCRLSITAPGFETAEVDVTLIRGKTLEQDIHLQSQALNIATA